MIVPRRSFISSLVAAVALSPLFCGFLRGIGFSGVSRDKRPPLELWEMESNWDGTLSPCFMQRYRVGEFAPKPSPLHPLAIDLHEDVILDEAHRLADEAAWVRRKADFGETKAAEAEYRTKFPLTYTPSSETGSFADIVSPKC